MRSGISELEKRVKKTKLQVMTSWNRVKANCDVIYIFSKRRIINKNKISELSNRDTKIVSQYK